MAYRFMYFVPVVLPYRAGADSVTHAQLTSRSDSDRAVAGVYELTITSGHTVPLSFKGTKMSGKSFRVSDGDWICPDKK